MSARKSKAPPPAKPRRKLRARKRRAWLGLLLGGVLGWFITTITVLLVWSTLAGAGDGQRVIVELRSADAEAAAAELQRAGLIRSPLLFRWYRRIVHRSVRFDPGQHLLNDALSPREIVQRLARTGNRARVSVSVPEGFNSFQIGERLQELEVCANTAFLAAARDGQQLQALHIPAASAEGYLFPARYEFYVNSPPEHVLRTMVGEMTKRWAALSAKHPGAVDRLKAELGFGMAEVLTLASIVEKETAQADERRQIASVFYNRLRSASFTPKGFLQSDPTAAYGCIAAAAQAPSCADYQGRVTPAMLRDAQNPYNTYRHPGLPPGPICSPGQAAIEATLTPADTEYLFFVASGGGRHVFSRTFEEHTRAVQKLQRATGLPATPSNARPGSRPGNAGKTK